MPFCMGVPWLGMPGFSPMAALGLGAPWPLPPEGDTTTYRDRDGNICRVGNSAGIRSKRLMDFPKKAGIPWEGEYAYGQMWYYEDGFICCKIRHLLEA